LGTGVFGGSVFVLGLQLTGGLSQGAPVAGNFGLGGQETVRNPGARESDRLFLAGWEVNQFWAELQFGAELSQQHHFEVIIITIMLLFIIVILFIFNYVEHVIMLYCYYE
jgi:hypothetical protein